MQRVALADDNSDQQQGAMATISSFLGEKVIKKISGDEVIEVETVSFSGAGKVVGIYFSAHWCPPCRAFTPKLAEWYNKIKNGPNADNFEIVFLSSDRDEGSFKEYFNEMPWHAVSFSDKTTKVAFMMQRELIV